MTDQLVKDNERIDDLQNGYYVIQDPDKFCFGMDAVLLSGFAKVKKGETALDLGTGTGIIPILLKTKTNGKHFTGLEIQKECADMAGRSVRYNHLEDDVEIVRGDIKEAADIFGAASFDVVTSNPPYMIGQHGLRNPDMPKAIARPELPAYVPQADNPEAYGNSSLPHRMPDNPALPPPEYCNDPDDRSGSLPLPVFPPVLPGRLPDREAEMFSLHFGNPVHEGINLPLESLPALH